MPRTSPSSSSPARAAQDDLVAVLEERPRRAVGEPDRLLAVPRQLDQRALAAALGPGDRARGDQIAGPGRRAVRRSHARAAAASSSTGRGVRPRRRLLPLSSTSSSRSSAQSRLRARYASGGGSCAGAVDGGVLEQRERRHPGGDRRRERLAEERPERLVLPRLEVPRAPVVDEHDAEDVVGNAPVGTGSPSVLPTPTTKPSSSSMSSRRLGPNVGSPRPAPSSDPHGRTTRCR